MFKVGKEKSWRKRLLSKNTLIFVITFPPDLFYQSDSSVQTIGVFLKKGTPHSAGQKVLWIRAINDGLVKRKGKRVSNPRVPNDLNRIKDTLQSYIQNQQIPIENIREFQKATSIDLSDPESHLEIVPEAYLDEKSPSISEIEEGLLKIVREGVAYLIKSGTVSLSEQFPRHNKIPFVSHNTNYGFFNVEEDLFALDRGDFHALDRLDEGVIPTVSRISDNNGVVGYFEPPDGAQLRQKGLLTVSTVTGDAFVQLTDFVATDNVLICYPKKPLRLTTIFFIQLMINLQRWRFSYGRQPYRRIFSSINIPLPIKDREIDEDYIETVVKNSYGWGIVERQLLAE
jgi:type I restriction enzyme M protein